MSKLSRILAHEKKVRESETKPVSTRPIGGTKAAMLAALQSAETKKKK